MSYAAACWQIAGLLTTLILLRLDLLGDIMKCRHDRVFGNR